MPNRAIFFASDVQSELQSALAGRTCSYLINSVCDPYLENSRLVELFPEIEKQKWQLYLYRPYQTIVAERVMWVYNRLKEKNSSDIKNGEIISPFLFHDCLSTIAFNIV